MPNANPVIARGYAVDLDRQIEALMALLQDGHVSQKAKPIKREVGQNEKG